MPRNVEIKARIDNINDLRAGAARLSGIVETDRPHQLKSLLESAYGIRNTVRKTRELSMIGRARVHIDDVESLGYFLELEVVLAENENAKDGEREAHELMEKLGIDETHLVRCAYVDLLPAVRP